MKHHIAIDVGTENELLFSGEVTSEVVVVFYLDVRGRPLVDIEDLEFQGVSVHHQCGSYQHQYDHEVERQTDLMTQKDLQIQKDDASFVDHKKGQLNQFGYFSQVLVLELEEKDHENAAKVEDRQKYLFLNNQKTYLAHDHIYHDYCGSTCRPPQFSKLPFHIDELEVEKSLNPKH